MMVIVAERCLPAVARGAELVLPPVFLQGTRLVDGFAAALVAPDEVLRVVSGGADRAPGDLGVLGDLLFHCADRHAAVRVPADLVAFLRVLRHALLLPVARNAIRAVPEINTVLRLTY